MKTHHVLLAGALTVALSGCGGGGLTVSGTVTHGGQPLAAGAIAFEPEPGSGTTGAGVVLPVTDGKFSAPADRRLPPGKYVVRVSPPPLGSGADLRTSPTQFRPYETKMELKADGGPLSIDVPAR